MSRPAYKNSWLSVLTLLSLMGIVVCQPTDSVRDKGEEFAIPVDEKSDSFKSPTSHGQLRFGIKQEATIADSSRFHSWNFSLANTTIISLAVEPIHQELDTVVYLYRQDEQTSSWGKYIAKSDDANETLASSLDIELGKGHYLVLVKGYSENSLGNFSLVAVCQGEGCLATGCDQTELPSDYLSLSINLKWSCGEGEDNPSDPSVVWDEDEGEYLLEQKVTFGPISECLKPPNEAKPEAVCHWSSPSSWWSMNLWLRADQIPTLNFEISAGDADTNGDFYLPVSGITAAGPWRMIFSPDNASGAWGHVEVSIVQTNNP